MGGGETVRGVCVMSSRWTYKGIENFHFVYIFGHNLGVSLGAAWSVVGLVCVCGVLVRYLLDLV